MRLYVSLPLCTISSTVQSLTDNDEKVMLGPGIFFPYEEVLLSNDQYNNRVETSKCIFMERLCPLFRVLH